jgi:hypothetical protein
MNLKNLGKSFMYTLGTIAGMVAWFAVIMYAPSWLSLGLAVSALWFMMYKLLKD